MAKHRLELVNIASAYSSLLPLAILVRNRNDTKENILDTRQPSKLTARRNTFTVLRDGETVEFAVVEGEKGAEAANVTGQ